MNTYFVRHCAVRHFMSYKKLAVSFLWEREDNEYIFLVDSLIWEETFEITIVNCKT